MSAILNYPNMLADLETQSKFALIVNANTQNMNIKKNMNSGEKLLELLREQRKYFIRLKDYSRYVTYPILYQALENDIRIISKKIGKEAMERVASRFSEKIHKKERIKMAKFIFSKEGQPKTPEFRKKVIYYRSLMVN